MMVMVFTPWLVGGVEIGALAHGVESVAVLAGAVNLCKDVVGLYVSPHPSTANCGALFDMKTPCAKVAINQCKT